MRTYLIPALMLALVIAALPVYSSQSYAPGHILVSFKSDTPNAKITAFNRQNAARVIDTLPQIGIQKISVAKGREMALARKYSSNPDVLFAQPDYVREFTDLIPNDPLFIDQWGLQKMQAPAAWEKAGNGDTIIVAVVDTGVDYRHPDLAGRVIAGYDFYYNDSDPMDENGHGTAVAGMIAAGWNNSIGPAGVAPNCLLMPCKIANSSGSTADSIIAKAIVYAADHSARVINMSFAGPAPSGTLQSAIDYAYSRGVVMTGGAGNNGTSGVYYPAAYPNVIAVGCSNTSDQRSISNYGQELDVLTPDGAVTTKLGGSYGGFGATSGATAYATGVCALILSANTYLSPAQVMQVARESCDDVMTPGWDQYSGWGRMNASRAVDLALTLVTDGLDTTPPTITLLSPSANTVISGTVTLSAQATDNAGISKVEFYAGDTLIGAVLQEPYVLAWNTAPIADGQIIMRAKAVDHAGNSSAAQLTVNVDNPKTTAYTFSGSLASRGVAVHTVTVSAPAIISASLKWARGDLDLYLLDQSGNSVAVGKASDKSESITTGLLAPGTYSFKVVCNLKARYTLNVTCTEP